VADIASSCGFSDASHLGREFRKQFGMPPVMYREQRAGVAVGDAEGFAEAGLDDAAADAIPQ
jgi:AraC-like DNA-binding protein